MKGIISNLLQDYRGEWTISFRLDPDSVSESKRIFDREKGTLSITVKPWREKRTLTANAYFHVLVNKLASAMNISNEECKVWLVKAYGTVAENGGQPVMITLPKGTKTEDFYPYCEWLYGDEHGDTYQLYKQTHVMTGAEFSRLLSGTVEECKEQGIETLSPRELEVLYAQA